MNRICLILIIVLATCITPVAWAQTSKNEAILNKNAALLDKEAIRPGGEKVVGQKLEKEFNVNAARIDSLKDRKLGYGETAVVLAMAKKMSGGITDANVNRIVSLRQGPPVQGWGRISKKLGFKLGPVISSVKKVRTVSQKDIDKLHQEGKGEKSSKIEKQEKPTVHERPAGSGTREFHGVRGH